MSGAGTIKVREYKYWLTKNAQTSNCWIVVAQLDEMLSHKECILHDPQGKAVARDTLRLNSGNLQYVYVTLFEGDRATTIVQDDMYYYYIDNAKDTSAASTSAASTEDTDYKSFIQYFSSLNQLVHGISGGQRKRLGIKLPDKIKLRSVEQTALRGVTHIDFIGKTHEEQVLLWKEYVSGAGQNLNLAGFHMLDPKVIIDANKSSSHTQIILSQNSKFRNFEWLKTFPKATILSVWNIHNITDSSIATLKQYAPLLNILEFHNCVQLTGRILIDLSQFSLLDKLVINHDTCHMQVTGRETVITDEEWSKINNTTLSVLLIDSKNLTLDFIDMTLKHFKGLEHFIMNDEILAKLEKNAVNGHNPERISFHSISNVQSGFKRYRDVKIYDLIRNKCGNMFSESMLRKIKERNPDKAQIVDMLSTEQPKEN